MPRGDPKRMTSFMMHPILSDRLRIEAAREGRSQAAILEQALAEYLNVAPAMRGIPARTLELCPNCRTRVLYGRRGQCPSCKWDRSMLHKLKAA